MMRHLIVLALVAVPVLAEAQAPAPAGAGASIPFRGFISVDGLFQATSNDFDTAVTFRANAEDGQYTTDYTVKSGPAFDVSGGAIVWRQLGVGVGVSRFSRDTPAQLSADVPHPFFFNRPREVSGEVGGLKREELAFHVQARGVFPLRPGLQLAVFGGPSYFKVKQGVVTDFAYDETYPYDVATFRSATSEEVDESVVGFHAGADVSYFFAQNVGVGGIVRYAGASVDITMPDGDRVDVAVGGLQAGAGLRLRF